MRQLLEKYFEPDFFPATKNDLLDQCLEPEVYDFISNLEDDPNYKYNSIDDLLPLPKLTNYPFYTRFQTGFFYYKIIASDFAISVSKDGIEKHIALANIARWSAFEKVTREEFMQQYYKAQAEIRSLIFNNP